MAHPVKAFADLSATALTVSSFFTAIPWTGIAAFLATVWWLWRLWDKFRGKKDVN